MVYIMGAINISSVGKIYPNGTRALEDVNIEINDGEFVVLVGPSGCGKTTLLRMVAGLEDITEGEISIGDKIVNEVAPKDCLLYTSPSPRDLAVSRMPSSA